MLRINLIPEYVAQRRVSRKLTVAFTGLFLVIVSAMLGYVFGVLAPSVEATEDAAKKAVAGKAYTDNLKSQAAAITAAAQPTKAKLDFVDAVHAYNVKWAKLYDTLAQYTDPKMIYYSASVGSGSMAIAAYAPSIAEVGRYLEEIYKEPDFSAVSIDRLPGYPEAVVKKYYLHNHLIGVSSSGGTTTTGLGAGGGRPGFGGGLPGFGGGAGGGAQSFGGAPAGFTSGRGADSGPPAGGFGGGFGAVVGGTGGRSFGSRASLGPGYDEPHFSFDQILQSETNPLGTTLSRQRLEEAEMRNIVVKTQPQGFSINISATLKPDAMPKPPALPAGA